MKTSRVFETKTKGSIEENMEEPDDSDKQDHFVYRQRVNDGEEPGADQAMPDIVDNCTNTCVDEIADHTNIKGKKR